MRSLLKVVETNVMSLRLGLHVLLLAPFSLATPLIFLTYFSVMCEQHHRSSFNPFLNDEKNEVKTLRVHQARDLRKYLIDLKLDV